MLKIKWCTYDKKWQVGYQIFNGFQLEGEFDNFKDALEFKKKKLGGK